MSRILLSDSELILHPDGSIYHLHLHPEQVAPTIITVGDPDRVEMVSKYFDRIEHRVQKREFVTHTGEYNGKRLSVISTGIGPDNIDIVFNELDALFNIDLKTRMVKENHTPLNFIRIGTSGSLQASLDVDDFLYSSAAIGLDNMLHFYEKTTDSATLELEASFSNFLKSEKLFAPPSYAAAGGQSLLDKLDASAKKGITLTCPGFYGPQGRHLRLKGPLGADFLDGVSRFEHGGQAITNFEMETAAIYGLCQLLGHQAISCNAILANRIRGTFSKKPKESVDTLIQVVLDTLCMD